MCICFTKLEVTNQEGTSTVCEGPGYSSSSTQKTSSPGTGDLVETGIWLGIVSFMISQLDGFIEQLMTAEGVNKARWWMRSLFRLLTPAIGFAYVVVAIALSGRSLSAMNDYSTAWLTGVVLQQLLGVVECYVVYNMVSRCGLCRCCMPEPESKDDGEAAKDRDVEAASGPEGSVTRQITLSTHGVGMSDNPLALVVTNPTYHCQEESSTDGHLPDIPLVGAQPGLGVGVTRFVSPR